MTTRLHPITLYRKVIDMSTAVATTATTPTVAPATETTITCRNCAATADASELNTYGTWETTYPCGDYCDTSTNPVCDTCWQEHHLDCLETRRLERSDR